MNRPGAQDPGIRLSLPETHRIAADIDRDGFRVYKDAVPADLIDEMRAFWMPRMSPEGVNRRFVRGELFLGEPNFLSYSDISEWSMYRHFDFLWNEPAHALTRELHLRLHRHRNLAQGFHESAGLTYSDANYGIYISTSYYPPHTGHLKVHEDGHQQTPILHYMLPLTFKGRDYESGGLVCADKTGRLVDVDAAMAPGDIVFFDGRQKHGVERILPKAGMALGRLAIFAIPTFFLKDTRLGVLRRSLRIRAFELGDRLHLKKLKERLRSY